MFRQTGDAMGCQTVDATDEWKWSRKDLRREHDMVSAHCTVHRHRKAHLTGENHRRHFNIRGVDLDCSRRVQKLRCSLLVSVTEAMFEPVNICPSASSRISGFFPTQKSSANVVLIGLSFSRNKPPRSLSSSKQCIGRGNDRCTV
jgi:hypothetical protein